MSDQSGNNIGLQFTDDLAKITNPIVGRTFVFVGNSTENTLYRCTGVGPAVWEAVAWGGVTPPSGLIYVFNVFFRGKPAASQFIDYMATEKCKIRATAPQSKGRGDTAATATATFNLAKGSGTGSPGAPFGTAVWSAAGQLAAFTVASDVTLDPATDDYLRITAPSSQDATLANVTLNIHSIRIP